VIIVEETIGGVCASALSSILSESENDLVIDYRTKFENLWTDSYSISRSVKRVFIIWDGVPPDSSAGYQKADLTTSGSKEQIKADRLAPYLTALDWVLVYSLKLIKDENIQTYKDFSIHLIDLTASLFDNSFTSENAPTLLEAMPWVTLYAPLKHDRSAVTELPDPEQVKTGNGWANAKKTLQEAVAAGGKELVFRLERLAGMWQAWLVQSDDHHDANNTAGPLRLCQEKTDIPNTTLLQKSFATRLDWVAGELSENQKKILAKLSNYVSDTKDKLGKENLNIVLIDDMCDYGWGELFEQWCGVSKGDLTLIKEPNDILEAMQEWDADAFLKRDFGFRLFKSKQENSDQQNHQVIFLDLRLHGNPANKSGNERAERAFYQVLIKKIRLWKLHVKNQRLAWDYIKEDDLRITAEWVAATDVQEKPVVIHTLLPRVLALRAPHLPIIVMSSTTKRSVIEPLKPYGNIFTAMEKPKVVGSHDHNTERFRSQWREAWNHAEILLKTNKYLQRIKDLSSTVKGKIKIDNIPEKPYVEIYIDETGSIPSNFAVGGVVAIYDNNNPKLPVWDVFDNKLFEAGVCYYDPLIPPRRSLRHLTIKKKKECCAKELKSARTAMGTTVPKIFSFRLKYDDTVKKGNPDDYGDFMFFETSIKAIEGLLFETLRTYFLSTHFQVSIYLATRFLDNLEENEMWRLMKKYGHSLHYGEGDNAVDFVHGNTARPMLSQMFGERNWEGIFLDRCLAVVLKYENNPQKNSVVLLPNRFYCQNCGRYFAPVVGTIKKLLGYENNVPPVQKNIGQRNIFSLYKQCSCFPTSGVPDYRALHYLADEVLDTDCSKLHSYEEAGINIDEIPGFNDINDNVLQGLLQASRFAEKGDSALALITALSVLSRGTTLPDKSLKQIILARLARCLPNLSGDEYLKVAKATQKT
jgi:hypothetical protein